VLGRAGTAFFASLAINRLLSLSLPVGMNATGCRDRTRIGVVLRRGKTAKASDVLYCLWNARLFHKTRKRPCDRIRDGVVCGGKMEVPYGYGLD